MLKLFYAPGACSLIPHIILEEIGKPYEAQPINFQLDEQHSADYLTINPKGGVPALKTERGVLTEIPAILSFLARVFPEADLAPVEDHFAFAEMQAFHMYIATTIHPLFRQISRPEVFADGAEAKAALRDKVPRMADTYFAVIESMFADGRPYVHGARYTMSDPYLYVFASYLNIGDRGDIGKIPSIWAHRKRVLQRPAVRRALESEKVQEAFY